MYSTVHNQRGGIGRLVWWAFWAVVIIYIVRHPSEAAINARSLLSGLEQAAESIATFVQRAGAGGQ